MNLNTARPLGDATTVLDLADRDEMDDDLFPLTSSTSWFTRDSTRRVLNFTPVIQEFVPKGSAEFGGKLVFELGSVKSCDLLHTVALQVRLGHWFPPSVVEALETGAYTYNDPSEAWYYANSLGTCLFARADFMLEDQILETVDGDFANLFALLYSDINTQFGVGIDANGRVPFPALLSWPQHRVFPTTNGIITCILPFSFQRIRLRNGFPLTSVKEGTIRVAITLRPFDQCIRIASGVRATCNETPLGKEFQMNITGGGSTVITASATVPPFVDCRLVTYGMLVDGKLRHALLKAPFERMYRDVATFRFSEPKKYVVNTPASGVVRLQLSIEINGPIEELIWFVRRKAVSINNEWINYSNCIENEYNETFRPLQSMLLSTTIQVNGISIVQENGDFFRQQIAMRHRGGIASYSNFVYGYCFAETPGRQNPTGWMNASRSSDIRLRMDIQPPGGQEDLEFEIVLYAISINWVRFENGIANRVFSS